MEGFELFDNKSVTRVVDKITITKNYLLNFPSAFYKINQLYGAKSVLLYYNKEAQKVGIKFRDDYDERGFKITNSGTESNGGGYITAKNFFAINGLIGKIETGRYEYSTENTGNTCKDKFFVIQLKSN